MELDHNTRLLTMPEWLGMINVDSKRFNIKREDNLIIVDDLEHSYELEKLFTNVPNWIGDFSLEAYFFDDVLIISDCFQIEGEDITDEAYLNRLHKVFYVIRGWSHNSTPIIMLQPHRDEYMEKLKLVEQFDDVVFVHWKDKSRVERLK